MSAPDPVIEHSRRVIERGSRSFTRAAALLAPEIRDAGYQLYAWCRYCDDVIDEQALGHPVPESVRQAETRTQAERLAELRALTTAALDGQPVAQLEYQGLARIVARYQIPRLHCFEFLDGMAMDVDGRRYRTIDELVVYCYRVAGVVGVMMAHVMGVRDAETLKRAEDLGIAMQLTNIARDVMDDAGEGRVYLPLQWLVEAGVDPQAVGRSEHRATVATVVARLLDEAEARYARADEGIAHLPFQSAWAIAAARAIYSDIGRVIRGRGALAWDRRAVVTPGRKYLLVLRTLARTAAGALVRRSGRQSGL
ncbi:MAG: phytoene/squalene synthase family protein [Gemmatimonadales bacterium]